MVRIGVSGAYGKMGRRIIALAGRDNDVKVVFGLEKSGYSGASGPVEGVVGKSFCLGIELVQSCGCGQPQHPCRIKIDVLHVITDQIAIFLGKVYPGLCRSKRCQGNYNGNN